MEGQDVGVRTASMRRIPLSKRTGAVVYGLALTVGVLFILRAELVEKFNIPLLFFYGTGMDYSTDGGASWESAENSQEKDVFTLTLPEERYKDVLLRIADADVKPEPATTGKLAGEEYSLDGGKTWIKSQRLADELDVPLVTAEGAGVKYSTDAGATWKPAAESAEKNVFSLTLPERRAVVLRPIDTDVEYVPGASGTLAADYSLDGGETWVKAERKAAGMYILAATEGQSGAVMTRIARAAPAAAAAEAAPAESVPAQKEETWSSRVLAAAERTGGFALAAAVGLYGAWMFINAVYVVGLLFFRESALQPRTGGAQTRLGTRMMYVLAGVFAALLAGLWALRAGMDMTRVSFLVVAVIAVLLGLVVERKYLLTWVALMLAALAIRALHGAGILGLGLISWATALAVVVPSGILITWVVLRLGYFKGKAAITTLVFFTLFGLTMIIPFLWMISTAFKTQEATSLFKVQWIAWPIRWANFSDVFSRVPYARFYLNSIFLASYVTIGLVFTSSLAAYSFARLEFPGRDKIFMAYLGTMMIPSAVTSIPVFVLMCKIGWVDSYKAIIIPGIFSAYGTFMLRQFFMTLPGELEDAAKIDGCSLFGIFYRIILPLSKPAVATLTIFTFMGSWGDFMWPLIILNDPNKMPLPVGLQFFARAETPDPNVLMCASMLMILPVIIVFLLGQRYFVEGIQLGAIKG